MLSVISPIYFTIRLFVFNVDFPIRKSAKAMEELLKRELGTKKLVSYGSAGGGCISSGVGYDTDSGPVFVKINNKHYVRSFTDQ